MFARATHLGQPTDSGPTIQEVNARQKADFDLLEFHAQRYGATVIYPHKALCAAEKCRFEMNGIPLYFDSNHLSEFGARSISFALEPIFDVRLRSGSSTGTSRAAGR